MVRVKSFDEQIEEVRRLQKRRGCIYRLTCKIIDPILGINKQYYGQTSDFKRRMSDHKNNKTSKGVDAAIQKYGWDNFSKEIVIDNMSGLTLNYLEDAFIFLDNTLAPNGYNLQRGGTRNYTVSDETRQRNREAALKYQANRETWGSVKKRSNGTFEARGPREIVDGKQETPYLGVHETDKDARTAIDMYRRTGEKPARQRGQRGTGSVSKTSNGKFRAWGPSEFVDGKKVQPSLGTYDTEKDARAAIALYKTTGKKPVRKKKKAEVI